MKIRIFDDPLSLAKSAADRAAEVICQTQAERGRARIVASTGESQVDFLRELVAHHELDWATVEVFSIGEYIGLAEDHPASLRRFLQDRLVAKTGIRHFVSFGDEANRSRRIAEAGAKLRSTPADIAFVTIGESGHLGLNSPPADFEAQEAYAVIDLDLAFRQHQVNEGWFVDVGQVPMQAISMSINQIMKAKEILAIAPGASKTLAVKVCVEHGISPMAPATILRTHPNAALYLDRDSSAKLSLAENELSKG